MISHNPIESTILDEVQKWFEKTYECLSVPFGSTGGKFIVIPRVYDADDGDVKRWLDIVLNEKVSLEVLVIGSDVKVHTHYFDTFGQPRPRGTRWDMRPYQSEVFFPISDPQLFDHVYDHIDDCVQGCLNG